MDEQAHDEGNDDQGSAMTRMVNPLRDGTDKHRRDHDDSTTSKDKNRQQRQYGRKRRFYRTCADSDQVVHSWCLEKAVAVSVAGDNYDGHSRRPMKDEIIYEQPPMPLTAAS